MAYRILIVDDSPAVRRSLRSHIAQNSAWEVCGEADNGQIAVEKVVQLHPDLVILDLSMPVMNGLDAARRIAQISPQTTMVMFTLHKLERIAHEAAAVGIKSVFSKSDDGPAGLFSWLSTECVIGEPANRTIGS